MPSCLFPVAVSGRARSDPSHHHTHTGHSHSTMDCEVFGHHAAHPPHPAHHPRHVHPHHAHRCRPPDPRPPDSAGRPQPQAAASSTTAAAGGSLPPTAVFAAHPYLPMALDCTQTGSVNLPLAPSSGSSASGPPSAPYHYSGLPSFPPAASSSSGSSGGQAGVVGYGYPGGSLLPVVSGGPGVMYEGARPPGGQLEQPQPLSMSQSGATATTGATAGGGTAAAPSARGGHRQSGSGGTGSGGAPGGSGTGGEDSPMVVQHSPLASH